MPEYLAPAVYVEEVDTGSKPIEGVSTSTAGMIGVTERGPVNVPMLLTSFGEYQRLFGQMLEVGLYQDHRFLPHAVEGFFTNGGKRVFVTRILDPTQARAAERQLVAPDAVAPLSARLFRPGSPTNNQVVIDVDPGFANGDTIQIDDGLNAEFIQLNAAPTAATLVTVRRPLDFGHAGGDGIRLIDGADNMAAGEAHADTTVGAVVAGAPINVTGAVPFNPVLAPGDVFRLDAGNNEELVVAGPGSAGATINPVAPTQLPHGPGTQIHRIITAAAAGAPPPTTIAAGETVTAGSIIIPVVANVGLLLENTTIEITSVANPAQIEYRRLGAFQRVPIDQSAYQTYPIGVRIERVALGAPLAPAVDLVERTANPGDTVITVSSRTGMVPGAVLRIGVVPQQEIVEIVALPGPLPAPNRGPVVLRGPLRFQHQPAPVAVGTVRAFAAPGAPANAAVTSIVTEQGANALLVNRSGFAAGDLLRVTLTAGGPFYHTAQAPVGYVPTRLSLATPLMAGHPAGIAIARRSPMMTVRALDAGVWGNRLRVAMEEQDTPLLRTQIRQVLPGGTIRLNSTSNVEVGTELVVTTGAGDVTFRVQAFDRQNDSLITPNPALVGVAMGQPVRSREYRFVVELLRQPDASNPARNTMAIDREVFQNLSLDRRHSRYFETVIGSTWNLTNPATIADDRGRVLRRGDRRSEGESQYVRVFDAGFAASQNVRPGPVAAYQVNADGTRKLVLLPLFNGLDWGPGLAPADIVYIGTDNVSPELRTGLFTLRNIEDISIVAAPGRTNATMQMALINHCELMRYRFAVLDGPPPPADSIPDVQTQRQQFDTKYAALYHPWLLIADPFPTGTSVRQDYPIAPAGHMLGIYARTDIDRGVHKAPANEVVRGVIGLQRVLNKEQHDILNPYPVNINVIRDFRTNNRGIRVYGGRVITSDSDWKYVNVRRLLIFIEASIDRGLQWVVFEPNAEPLWARVRRSIANFLTLVWRNGGLEGTKVEEAFFVKCDRTTMTQTDIDQGRLICLVGVAPVKPAEFVIVRIGLWTAHAED